MRGGGLAESVLTAGAAGGAAAGGTVVATAPVARTRCTGACDTGGNPAGEKAASEVGDNMALSIGRRS